MHPPKEHTDISKHHRVLFQVASEDEFTVMLLSFLSMRGKHQKMKRGLSSRVITGIVGQCLLALIGLIILLIFLSTKSIRRGRYRDLHSSAYNAMFSMLGKEKGFLHLPFAPHLLLFAICLLLSNFCGPHITAFLCPVPHCLLVMVAPFPVKLKRCLPLSPGSQMRRKEKTK